MQPRGSQRAHHIGHTWLTIKHKGGDHRRTISYTIIAIIAHWIHRLPALFYLNSFFLFAKQLDPNLFSLCLLAFFLAYSVAVEIWWFCPLKKLQHGPKTILLFAIPSLSPRRRTALWEYSAQRANKRQWQVRAAHEKTFTLIQERWLPMSRGLSILAFLWCPGVFLLFPVSFSTIV